MENFIHFLAKHSTSIAIIGSLLLILFGIGLLFRPGLVVEIFRFLFAITGILSGSVLFIRTVKQVGKKHKM